MGSGGRALEEHQPGLALGPRRAGEGPLGVAHEHRPGQPGPPAGRRDAVGASRPRGRGGLGEGGALLGENRRVEQVGHDLGDDAEGEAAPPGGQPTLLRERGFQ